jgi:5-oxoprolinase (ATP-hydrolysing)
VRAQAVPVASVETLATLRVKYAGTDTPLRRAAGRRGRRSRAFEDTAPASLRLHLADHGVGGRDLSVEAIGHSDAGAANRI